MRVLSDRLTLGINHRSPLSCKSFKGENRNQPRKKNSFILYCFPWTDMGIHRKWWLPRLYSILVWHGDIRETLISHNQDVCAPLTILNYSKKNRTDLITDRWKYEHSYQEVLDCACSHWCYVIVIYLSEVSWSLLSIFVQSPVIRECQKCSLLGEEESMGFLAVCTFTPLNSSAQQWKVVLASAPKEGKPQAFEAPDHAISQHLRSNYRIHGLQQWALCYQTTSK